MKRCALVGNIFCIVLRYKAEKGRGYVGAPFASFLTLSYITAQTGHIYEYHYFSHQVRVRSSAKMYDFNYENTQGAPYSKPFRFRVRCFTTPL